MSQLQRARARSAVVDAGVVAKLLEVSPASVYAHARSNDLPFKAINIGRTVRFHRRDVKEFFGFDDEQLDALIADEEVHVDIHGYVADSKDDPQYSHSVPSGTNA